MKQDRQQHRQRGRHRAASAVTPARRAPARPAGQRERQRLQRSITAGIHHSARTRLRTRTADRACYRLRAGSRPAWCRCSASALTRAYLASDRTEVWPDRAISIGVPVPSSASCVSARVPELVQRRAAGGLGKQRRGLLAAQPGMAGRIKVSRGQRHPRLPPGDEHRAGFPSLQQPRQEPRGPGLPDDDVDRAALAPDLRATVRQVQVLDVATCLVSCRSSLIRHLATAMAISRSSSTLCPPPRPPGVSARRDQPTPRLYRQPVPATLTTTLVPQRTPGPFRKWAPQRC